jgi:hypothetical protein
MDIRFSSGGDGAIRLSMTGLKKFSKFLRRRFAEIGYNQCLDRLCRSAGYRNGYYEALHRPRDLRVSYARWREQLSEHLQISWEASLPEDELEVWYSRVFRPAAMLVQAADDEDGGGIPKSVDHLRTIVDALAQPGRQYRHTP